VLCVDILAEELTGLDRENEQIPSALQIARYDLLDRQVRIESARVAELQGKIGTIVALGNDETLLVECLLDDGLTTATVLQSGGWVPFPQS
jgi:hypothetical protein